MVRQCGLRTLNNLKNDPVSLESFRYLYRRRKMLTAQLLLFTISVSFCYHVMKIDLFQILKGEVVEVVEVDECNQASSATVLPNLINKAAKDDVVSLKELSFVFNVVKTVCIPINLHHICTLL